MENYREDHNRDNAYRRKGVNAADSASRDRYKQNRSGEADLDHGKSRDADDRNIRVGRELHNNYDRNDYDRYGHRKDDQHNRSQGDQNRRQTADRKWDEGTFFHTGPADHGSEQYRREQERNQSGSNRDRGNLTNHYRNQDRQMERFNDQHDHYGSRPDSVYRQNSLDRGDHHQSQYGQQRDASRIGSGYESNRQPIGLDHNPHTEGPGTGSRYKEDDYRYGSGNHNFYKEGRYQRGGGIGQGFDDNKGFFERVGDGIRDAWDSVTNDDRDNVENSGRRDYRDQDRHRDGRDHNFDRGREPRQKGDSEARTDSKRGDYPTGWRNSKEASRDDWGNQNRRREDRW